MAVNHLHVIDYDEEYKLLFHSLSAGMSKISADDVLKDLNEENIKLPDQKKDVLTTPFELGKGRIGMTFMSSNTCNLACEYCYEQDEGLQYKSDKPVFGTYDNYMKALHTALIMYPEGIKKISFFGGEPLLNISQIKRFVPDCIKIVTDKKLQIPRFSMTTNGLLLNREIAIFIKEYKIALTISLDGGKTVNDKVRKYKNSTGSVYQEVVKKCRLLDQYDIHYYLQATLNVNHIRNYQKGNAIRWIRELENINFKNISVIPVETDHTSLKISDKDLPGLKAFTKELTQYYFDKIMAANYQISSIMMQPILLIAKNERTISCPAGHSVFVDTDGKVYPCHMFCHNEKFQIGNIREEFDKNAVNEIANISREKGEKCSVCIAGKVCLMWCKGIQYLSYRDVHQVCRPRCVFQETIVEESIKLLYQMKEDVDKSNLFWTNYKRYCEYLHNLGYAYKANW